MPCLCFPAWRSPINDSLTPLEVDGPYEVLDSTTVGEWRICLHVAALWRADVGGAPWVGTHTRHVAHARGMRACGLYE